MCVCVISRVPVFIIRHGLCTLMKREATFIVSNLGGLFRAVVVSESSGVLGSVPVGISFIGLKKGLMQSDLHVSVHSLTTMRGKFVEYVQG